MPRGEGGYKSKNKTKDGKNKSWFGKKADGSWGRVYAKGEGPAAKKAAPKKAAAKKAAPAKKGPTRPKARKMDSSPKPVGRKDSGMAKGKVKAPVAVGGARAAKAKTAKRAKKKTKLQQRVDNFIKIGKRSKS
jgi:hypothetical protein